MSVESACAESRILVFGLALRCMPCVCGLRYTHVTTARRVGIEQLWRMLKSQDKTATTVAYLLRDIDTKALTQQCVCAYVLPSISANLRLRMQFCTLNDLQSRSGVFSIHEPCSFSLLTHSMCGAKWWNDKFVHEMS